MKFICLVKIIVFSRIYDPFVTVNLLVLVELVVVLGKAL